MTSIIKTTILNTFPLVSYVWATHRKCTTPHKLQACPWEWDTWLETMGRYVDRPCDLLWPHNAATYNLVVFGYLPSTIGELGARKKKLCPRHAYTTILFTVCIAGWSKLHVLEYFIVVCLLKMVETASTRVGLVVPLEYMKKEMLHGGSNPTCNRTQ